MELDQDWEIKNLIIRGHGCGGEFDTRCQRCCSLSRSMLVVEGCFGWEVPKDLYVLLEGYSKALN